MSDVTIQPAARLRQRRAPARKGLKAGALRMGDVVIMALASSGPTQSIAVGIVGLMIAVYYHTFMAILICFIPMIGIAIGYQRLNAWQPSAGATYSWVGRALNPHAGFFAGWIMLMYYTIGTTSLTVPLGTYFLSFFSNSAANNKYWVALVGIVFDILVLIVAALGIKLSAHFNWAWAVFEYALMIGFAVAAIIMIYVTGLSGSVHTIELAVHAAQDRPGLGHPDRHLPVLGLGHRCLRRAKRPRASRPAAPPSCQRRHPLLHLLVRDLRLPGHRPVRHDGGQPGQHPGLRGRQDRRQLLEERHDRRGAGRHAGQPAGRDRQLGAHLVRHGPRPRVPEVLRQCPCALPHALERHHPARSAQHRLPVGLDALLEHRRAPSTTSSAPSG